MNKLLFLGALVAILLQPLSSTPAMAQDESDSTQAEEGRQQEAETEEQKEQAENGDDEEAAQEQRRSDRFIPSEEISEDLSVSFPVDI